MFNQHVNTSKYADVKYGFISFSVYSLNSATTCPDLHTLFIQTNSNNLYVAAYSDSNPSNITSDWLPVISYTSYTTSTTSTGDQNGILTSTATSAACYIKLDIQIAYTNIGSVLNPQPVLSAVIFNYQGIVSENL